MRDWQRRIFITYLITCPVVYTLAHTNLRGHQEMFWHYMAMGLVTTFSRNVWLVIFFMLNVILVASNNFEVGQKTLFNIFLGIVLFTCMRSYFKHFNFMRESKYLLIVGAFTLIWMCMQYFGVDPLYVMKTSGQANFDVEFRNLIGLFGSQSHNGIFLSVLVPIITAFWGLYSLALLPLIVTSLSSAALMAAAVGLLFYLFHINKKQFIIILPILILFGSFHIFMDAKNSGGIFTSRFPLWHATFKMSLDEPIFGYGPGSYANRTPRKDFQFFGDQDFRVGIGKFSHVNEKTGAEVYGVKEYNPNFFRMHTGNQAVFLSSPNRWSNAHNLFFQVFFEYGLCGVLLAFFLLKEMYYRFKYAMKSKELVLITSILLIYMVSSLTQFPLYVARLGFLFPIVLGAFYAVTDERTSHVR